MIDGWLRLEANVI